LEQSVGDALTATQNAVAPTLAVVTSEFSLLQSELESTAERVSNGVDEKAPAPSKNECLSGNSLWFLAMTENVHQIHRSFAVGCAVRRQIDRRGRTEIQNIGIFTGFFFSIDILNSYRMIVAVKFLSHT
jgi:hypothetical protein